MAQQLWFLRHGEAVPHASPAPDDDRALTDRGRGQAVSAGRALAALELVIHDVWTSPKVRAFDTAVLACESLGIEPVVHEPLRGGFTLGDARALMHAAGADQRVLLVGHEPDFSQVVLDLTGARIELKKGGVAGVRIEGTQAELIALMRPRELDRIAAAVAAS